MRSMTPPRWILLVNNVTTAVRQMYKNKLFASITIFSLSASMVSCLLIFQYAGFELSFDRQYPNVSNIYRLNLLTYQDNVLQNNSALLPVDARPTIKNNIPGLDASVQIISTASWFDCSLTYRDRSTSITFNEKNVAYADNELLNVFDYEIKAGNRATALSDPYSVVLSESAVIKYFGSSDPIGKILHLRGSSDTHDYVVTAVMKDPPGNSHLPFDILLSLSSTDSHPNRKPLDSYVYVVPNDHTPVELIQQKVSALAATYPVDAGQRFDIAMEPVSEIHLHSNAEDQPTPRTDPTTIYLLLAIAFVVLMLAWINYTNLAIARSFARAKEVGIRKVSGATRPQIIVQFLTETFLYNIICIVITLCIVYVSSPLFYRFVGISFPWDRLYWIDLGITGWVVIAVVCGGMLLSGVLPAHFLASISPANVLKGKFMAINKGLTFRRASVIFQFVCAIALMTAVITCNKQFRLLSEQHPGINFERTMMIKSPSNADSTFRNRLSQLSASLQQQSIVEKAFTGGNIFQTGEAWTADVSSEDKKSAGAFIINIIDPDFIDGYDLKLLAGRNFEVNDYPGRRFGDKIEPLILNRTAIERLGLVNPVDAIGETIYWDGKECRVVGVIEDFRQRSAKEAVGPGVYTANNGSTLSLQLTQAASEDLSASIPPIKREWDKFFPENGFDFFMLADFYSGLFQGERQMRNIFQFFCAIAIVISCLGLFALSLFSVNQRAKEMSIHKVLGASKIRLLGLLTYEYAIMILVAGIIGLPFTVWGIDRWLSNFDLRVEVGLSTIIATLATVFVFAFISIGFQTWRVVSRNPTESLKGD
ncbi:MAG TPA: ABC transporter permease [Cyclobacteriaceae bacterium]|nr:ABC transporter permease [Cyclobacteriaceae bacterium]